MKVIGKISSDEYICTIRHSEVEKFMNLYYNNLKKLNVGDEISLATGYEFHSDVKEMLTKTEAFLSVNKKMIKTITDGISFLAIKETKD